MKVTEEYAKKLYRQIRSARPVIHCITNTVTVNDCANVLLACGASPTMAHHPAEVAEITSAASALVCNLGATENYDAMVNACKAAGEVKHPVVIDPVGISGSAFRRNFINELIKINTPACIRGNYSEIRALMENRNTITGVDAADKKIDISGMKSYAAAHNTILIASGATDVITDGKDVIYCNNGDSMMARITGSGCMLSVLIGAFLSVDSSVYSAAACCCMYGAAGEIAAGMTRESGGGIFVILYLVFLIIMGLPVLTMELAVGRASRKSAVLSYKALEKPKAKWHIHGWFAMLGCYILMMYYTTVSGWMSSYFFKFVTGEFKNGMDSAATGAVFTNLLDDPVQMLIWMGLTVVVGFLVCSRGLQNGLEKISKIMMVALLGLIVVLAVHSIMLPGASKGIEFYLVPNIDRVKEVGVGNVVSAAMNQAFFTLSLGVAAMEIFGSYMSKDNTLAGEGIKICGLDTFVAIMAGLIIFPACFSYGVDVSQGPSLIFVTLPNVFVNMEGGRIWGSLFFLFMTFASFSTIMAVFENIMSFCIDMFGWSRNKAAIINCIVILIASVPCVLGYNLWSGLHIIGGRDVLDSEDFIVSNLLLPIGSLVYTLFCVTRWGWGFDNYIDEANTGKGVRIARRLKPYFKFVLPVLIVIIIVQGFIK